FKPHLDQELKSVALPLGVAQWLARCCLTARRSWVRLPAGAGPFCVEFACSPHVRVGSLWVLRLPPTSKDMHVR
ncbi:hypothetical protein LDENG_00224350, partial [Lucifuga dentata]